MSQREFEYVGGSSEKFWNIELQGTSHTVQFGRIGTAGQTKTKEFDSEEKANASHDKLISEKLKKGYVEVSGGKTASPAANVPDKRQREAFEKMIAEDPTKLENRAVYADWLIEQGDPRGEFIQIQLQLEDESRSPKERKSFQAQERKLLKTHSREWLGELAEFLQRDGVSSSFARGYLDSLQIGELNVSFARALAKAPEVWLLRRLEIEDATYQDEDEYEPGDDVPEIDDYDKPGFYPLARACYFGGLEVLSVGEPSSLDADYFDCHLGGEGVADLIEKAPRLKELYLFCHNIDTDQLFASKTLTNLRLMHLFHGSHYPLSKLAGNEAFSNLTHLAIHPHAVEPGEAPYLDVEDLEAIVNSPYLKKLTHLHFRLSNAGDAGCDIIARSDILGRLKILDLRSGVITDEGARILAGCPQLKNLELLELAKNAITEDGLKALEATGVNVQAGEQHDGSEDAEWSWDGDIE